MTDQDVQDRLTAAGERFQRATIDGPSLEAAVDVAARRGAHRWLWPAAAAAAVLVVSGVVVSSRDWNGHTPESPRNTVEAAPAPSITSSGQVLTYLGSERWSDPVLDEADPSVVYVYAKVDGPPNANGVCGSTPVARVVSEDSSAVRIAVALYSTTGPPSSPVACAAIGFGPARLRVQLAQPLGQRSLIDAENGATRPVLDPSTVPKLGSLPAGYTGGDVTWDDRVVGAATRTYVGPGGTLIVTTGPASLNRPLTNVLEHTMVRGHPATVSYDTGFMQDLKVAWTEDAAHAVTVYQVSNDDAARTPLSAQDLVQIANDLR